MLSDDPSPPIAFASITVELIRRLIFTIGYYLRRRYQSENKDEVFLFPEKKRISLIVDSQERVFRYSHHPRTERPI